MANRFWVLGTGNTSDTAHWSATTGGAGGETVPVAGDSVTFDSNSGTAATVTVDVALSAASITINKSDLTLLHNAGTTLTGAMTLTTGTLNTNGQTCSWGSFSSSNSNTRTLTLGASAITITAGGTSWDTSTPTNLATPANTATLTMSGASALFNGGSRNWNGMSIVFSGSGAARIGGGAGNVFANVTRTGTAAKTDSFLLNATLSVTGTMTLGGNTTQGVNRLLVQGLTVGSQATITAAAYVINGDVDFMDINLAYSGGASWTNAGAAFIGDALGNAGAVTTNATVSATQTATGTASFTWSTHGWTSRVPLPQDDVVINNAFVAGRTITADMPRLGRSIDFTGTTGTPALNLTTGVTMHGSLTLISGMTFTGIQTVTFAGRSAGLTITSATRSFPGSVVINAPSGTYTLSDAFSLSVASSLSLTLALGSLVATGNVTVGNFVSNVAGTRALTMGSGTWNLYRTGTTNVWNVANTGAFTFDPGTAIIDITATDSGVTKTFVGDGLIYPTLRHTATGTAALTITGANTFTTLDLETNASARTITFPASTTTTVTGTMTLTGSGSARLAVISSSAGTAATISAATVAITYSDFKDITASGTASPFTGTLLGSVSGNTNITTTARFWVGGSATWDGSTTANWSTSSGGASGASVPTAASDVGLDVNSGASTVTLSSSSLGRSLNASGFTGTISHPAATTLNLGDSTAGSGNIALLLVAGLTYTLGDVATSAISFISTSTTVQTVTTGTKTLANLTFNGTAGSWQLTDAMTIGSTATVTLTTACSWGLFTSTASNTRALTLGASAITLTSGGTALTTGGTPAITLAANTAVITFTGAGAGTSSGMNWNGTSLVFSGSGVAFTGGSIGGITNLTRTGTAIKTDALSFSSAITLTGTCTLGGNTTQGVNRLLVQSNTVGTSRTITAAAYVITGDVDFMDINLAYSGGASWTNAGSAYIGDALGNAGAVTTNATVSATQTATGTASFTWSTHGWTSRVPLPQDDVVINNAFVAGRTVTIDMPRLGRNITWTGATGAPTWTGSTACVMYGNLTMAVGVLTSGGSTSLELRGRGTHTITTTGCTMRQIAIWGPGGTYTLQDGLTLSSTNRLWVLAGTFNANGFNIAAQGFEIAGSTTRTVNMGSGTWTVLSTGTMWNAATTTGLTLVPGTATIDFTDTSATAKTFAGGGLTYPTLRHIATGSAALTITGNNTFAALDLECTTARTITFPASGTQTVTGTFTALGAAGQLLSLRSSSTGTKWYITAATTSAQYCDVKDSTATGSGTPIDDTTGGVDSGNNIGWLFIAGGTAGYSSTLLTLGVG